MNQPKKVIESIVVEALESARICALSRHSGFAAAEIDKAIRIATLEHQAVELLREIRSDDSNRLAFGVRTYADELIAAYDKEST